MADPGNGPRDPQAEAQVAAALEDIRAGVRQRQAEVAALSDGQEGATAVELQIRGRLEEPVAVSALPVLGPLLILARKIMFKVFGRWYSRPLLFQQTHFNQLLAQRFAAQSADQQQLRQRVRELEEQVERLKAHLPAGSSELSETTGASAKTGPSGKIREA